MAVVIDVAQGERHRILRSKGAGKIGEREVVIREETKAAAPVVQKHFQPGRDYHHQVRVAVPVQIPRYDILRIVRTPIIWICLYQGLLCESTVAITKIDVDNVATR